MTAARSTDPKDVGPIDLEAVRPLARVGNPSAREQAEREGMQPPVNGNVLRARRVSRTQTLSTKVKPETMETLYRIVQGHQMSMVDVIEAAIADYDRRLRGVK